MESERRNDGPYVALGKVPKEESQCIYTSDSNAIRCNFLKVFALFVLFVHIFRMKRKVRKPKGAEDRPNDEAVHLEFPPPEYLLQKAHKVIDRKLIEDYVETIHVLRDEKRLTFREIAEWLSENGVPADHNGVYRAYTRHMRPDQIAEMKQRELEEAIGEADREDARRGKL